MTLGLDWFFTGQSPMEKAAIHSLVGSGKLTVCTPQSVKFEHPTIIYQPYVTETLLTEISFATESGTHNTFFF